MNFVIHGAANLTGNFQMLIDVDRTVNKVRVSFVAGNAFLEGVGYGISDTGWIPQMN